MGGIWKWFGRAGLVVSILLAPGTVLSQADPVGDPTGTQDLSERLESLVEELESQRVAGHIPGLAIAVVKNDEVILTRGLGVADVERGSPVTPETLFPIGSTTKSFTATLIGILVDEGRLDWDDPVTDHLPFFDLEIESEEEGAVVTIRDLLAHRTGFARMPILYVNGRASRDEVLRAAVNARTLVGFRQSFLYNNVMYLAAGTAAGSAAGDTWDHLMTDRLLEPLGMANSTSVPAEVPAWSSLASGYQWSGEAGRVVPQSARLLDAIAPAGSIVSNAHDMGRWIRFLLNAGQLDGERLITEESLRETWTGQIELGGGLHYGLGWVLREWEGQPVVEHNGNTRGYFSKVALLPESGIGFVMLANVTASALQERSMSLVWEALLGDNEVAAEGEPGEDVTPYLGTYLPTHRNAEFEVLESNGRLAVMLSPNPRPFELELPDETGKRRFVLSGQMAVSFEHDEEGHVVGMRIYQGGMEFECVRAGMAVPPEIDPAELENYLGSYRSEASGASFRIFVQNSRLAMQVPGGTILELRLPDEQGRRVVRIDPRSAVTFNRGPGGEVVSLTFHQPGGVDAELSRIDAPPGREDLMALRNTDGRRAALDRLGAFKLTGSVRMVHAGVEGAVEWLVEGTDRYSREFDFGRFGKEQTWVDGEGAWTDSPGAPRMELRGARLQEATRSHPAALFGAWSDHFASVRLLRTERLEDRYEYVVELGGGEAPAWIATVDGDTGDVLRIDSTVLDATSSISVPVRTSYEDYREVEGLRIPFRIVSRTTITGELVIQFEQIQVQGENGASASGVSGS
jgi:CubicO group peptidase (beta-lactamase class C family)